MGDQTKDLTVQAKDTIDISDYVLVHETYLNRLRQDLARYENAHKVLVEENKRLEQEVQQLHTTCANLYEPAQRIAYLAGGMKPPSTTEQAGDRT